MWVCFNVGICYSFPPYHLSKGNEAENHDASCLGLLLPNSNANMSTRLDHCHLPYQCLPFCLKCGLNVKFTSTNLVRNLNRSSNVSMAILIYSLSLAICGFGKLRALAKYSLCLFSLHSTKCNKYFSSIYRQDIVPSNLGNWWIRPFAPSRNWMHRSHFTSWAVLTARVSAQVGVWNYICKMLRKGFWATVSKCMLFHGGDGFNNNKLNRKEN